MNKEQYNEIERRLFQLMADASLVSELMRNARCSVPADRVLTICTDAGNALDRWKKIEPDWNAPDSSDCHTHS